MQNCKTSVEPKNVAWRLSDNSPVVVENQRVCDRPIYIALPLNVPESEKDSVSMSLIHVQEATMRNIVKQVWAFYGQAATSKDLARCEGHMDKSDYLSNVLKRQENPLYRYELLPPHRRVFEGIKMIAKNDDHHVYVLAV